MDLNGKKVLVLTTTDDMIFRFLLPHIKDMQKLGATIECACAKTNDYFFEGIKKETGATMHDIQFTRFPLTLKNFKAQKQLFLLCKNNKYDLIHCHQPVGGVMGRRVGKKFNVPVVYTAHGFHFFKGAPIQNQLIYKNIEKFYAKNTRALITMNEEDFVASKKFKAEKQFKINGIGLDLTKYQASPNKDFSHLKNEFGISEKNFVVVSVGELNKNKNTYRVLEAVKNTGNKNIKYLVCGEGPLKQKYIDYVEKNHLQEQVKILGFRKDVSDILNLADVFVMTSFREGLPKATMEAMNYGLPIIASNIRGCVDLIGNSEGGILIDPNKTEDISRAILKLFADVKLCKKFCERNKEFIKNFDIKIVLKQMREIYQEI